MREKLKVILLLLLCMVFFTGCSSSCKTDGCENERIEDSKYCTEHVCAVEECSNGKIGENYCSEHFNCAVENCAEERILNGAYCITHKCNVVDCKDIKKGESYCKKHQCLTEGCNNIRIGENYCEEHYKCELCGNERYIGAQYCKDHKCSYSAGAKFCNNVIVKNTKYCQDHLCNVSNCKKSIIGDSEYCSEHKCDECDEKRTSNSIYCKTHYQEQQARIKAAKAEADAKKDTVIVNRNGKKIWKVYMTDDEFRYKGTYTGTGNYIVKLLDDNQDYYASICNEIGDYVVDKTIRVTKGKYYYLETYCSDGRWSATWWGTYGN